MAKRKPYTITCEQQYKSDLDLLSDEIEAAVIIFHVMEEMNRLALHDPAIFGALNREPLFWQGYRSTCQTSLFVTMGRIFDKGSDAHSIHKVVSATIEHWDFFTLDSLKARFLARQPDHPDWLEAFIGRAWERPGAADLEFLRSELEPHAKLFFDVYKPIRDNVIGHRLMTDDHAAVALFPHTNREDVGRTLDFLQELINALIYLYNNGTQPIIGKGEFRDHNQSIRDEVQSVLRRLSA